MARIRWTLEGVHAMSAWLVIAILLGALSTARADDAAAPPPAAVDREAIASAPPARLVAEVRALQAEQHASAAADRARWAKVRARTDAFLDRFPDDSEAESMGLAHGLAAVRLGLADKAVADLDAFIARHPKSGRILIARYLRGLAQAERGADEAALRDLEAVQADDAAPDGLRDEAAYARAQVLVRRGETSRAVEALRALVERLPAGGRLSRAADADLKDLVRVGGMAPGAPQAEAFPTARVLVAVLRRAGDAQGEAALREAREALATRSGAVTPTGSRAASAIGLIDLPLEGFDDPQAQPFRTPALPRVYVFDGPALGPLEHRRLRAAGVRGSAIGAAVDAALGARPPGS